MDIFLPFTTPNNNACNNSYGFALNYLKARNKPNLGSALTCIRLGKIQYRCISSKAALNYRGHTNPIEEYARLDSSAQAIGFEPSGWKSWGHFTKHIGSSKDTNVNKTHRKTRTKKLQTSENNSLGESTYESLLRHAHKLSALAFFERGFFLWLIGLDAAMTILHESIWQTPRELSGVKSRKRPIFEIPLGSVDASSNAGIHRISGQRLSFVRLLKNVNCISLLKRSTLPRPNVLSAFWTCWASSFLASNMQPSWAKHQQHTLSWFALVVG